MRGAVAIPTFGRRELLWTCLESVMALAPPPPLVVVVDGNPEPMTFPFRLPDWIRVVREPNRGPAHARNTAYAEAEAAGAEIVCFLDDDAVAPPDWFARHLAVHGEHPEAGAVGGAITNLTAESLASEHLHRTSFAVPRHDPGPVRFIPSINISYKAACIADVGLFDETITEAAGEDVDHCARITAAGWTVWFEPDVVVGHHYPTSLRGLLKRQDLYGRGFVRTRTAHPDLPGAEFLDLPTWRVVAGYVPHLARSGATAWRTLGPRHAPLEVACQAVYRTAAFRERRRLGRASR